MSTTRRKSTHKRSVSSVDVPGSERKKIRKQTHNSLQKEKKEKKAKKDAKTTSSEEDSETHGPGVVEKQKRKKDKKHKKNNGKQSKALEAVRKELSESQSREEKMASLAQLKELIMEEMNSLDNNNPSSSSASPQNSSGELEQQRIKSDDSMAKSKLAKTTKKKHHKKGDKKKKGIGGSRSDTEADEKKQQQRHKKWAGWQKSFHWGGHHSNDNSANNTSTEDSTASWDDSDSSGNELEGVEEDEDFLDLLDFPARRRKGDLRSSSNVFDVSPTSELKILGHQPDGTTKLLPLVAEIAEGNFNYCEIHPRHRGTLVRDNESDVKASGGAEGSEVKDSPSSSSATPSTILPPPPSTVNKSDQGPRVLWGHREGYKFDILLKVGKLEPTVVEMATDNDYQRQRWGSVLWDYQPTDKVLVFGFLWMKTDKKKNWWKRYFCVSNGRYLEWFKTKNVVSLPLKSIKKMKKIKENVKAPYVKGTSRSAFLKKLQKFSNRFALILDTSDGSKKKISMFWDRSEKNVDLWNHLIASARKGGERERNATISRRRGTPVLGTVAASQILNTGPVNTEPKLFAGTPKSLETSTSTKLRNGLRQFNERAVREAGVTPFGNFRLDTSGVGDGHVRIICLDGGGIRGILETVILERLVEIFPTLLERTDMFAGISVGSMTATGLACGRSPRFLTELMCFTAPFLFDKKVRWTPLRSSKFSPKHLYITGRELLAGITLGDVPKGLLIPSFLLDNELEGDERSWEAQVFHNIPQKEPDEIEFSSAQSKIGKPSNEKRDSSEAEKEDSGSAKKGKAGSALGGSNDKEKEKEKEKDKDKEKEKDKVDKEKGKEEKDASDSEEEVVYSAAGAYFPKELLSTPVWDCVMGSAAAPTFFPSYKKQIDAAVMTNDPSLTAASMVLSHTAKDRKTPEQVHLLSLSTGTYPQYVDGEEHDWGMFQWGPYLLQLLIAASGLHERQLVKALLGDQFHRVDPVLKKSYPIDDESVLEELIEVARNFDLTETIAWIRENWFSEEEKEQERKEKQKKEMEKQREREKKEREKLRKEKKGAAKKRKKNKTRMSMGLHSPLTSEDCWYGSFNVKN